MSDLTELKGSGPRTLFTRQSPAVWDTLCRDGVYRVKKEHIRQKNDTISDFYLKLYEWYTKEAAHYIEIPKEAHYPIWFSVSEDLMLQPVEGSIILKVEVPESAYMLSNNDAWSYVVNYWYIPLDEEDEEAHIKELKRNGLTSDDELLLTDKGNFYPLLKRKLLDSWKRVFTLEPHDMNSGLVATAWEIQKEWVKEVRSYPSD